METQTAISQEKATAPTPDSDASDASDERQRDEDDKETKQQGPVDENNSLNECVDQGDPTSIVQEQGTGGWGNSGEATPIPMAAWRPRSNKWQQ
ncbi:unnamed protein product [Phytophthora fragariaefolia]|uniref:Unnamed protein product n=1 Tax=Phytophthora fragariaefolia TaxID=1490495 RepID=A0A9W6Y5D1_9STRA|nr:unnamed protein product [Phytophthora fragariaefolia]